MPPRAGYGYHRRSPGNQPLVPRAGLLRAFRRPHEQPRSHGTPRCGPLRRGVRAHSGRPACRRHPGPPGLYAPMGPYRRQPRLGGGIYRRPLALYGSLRACAHPRQRLVQRPRVAGPAAAHQGVRRLPRAGGCHTTHPLLHRNQRDTRLCACTEHGRNGP